GYRRAGQTKPLRYPLGMVDKPDALRRAWDAWESATDRAARAYTDGRALVNALRKQGVPEADLRTRQEVVPALHDMAPAAQELHDATVARERAVRALQGE